MARIQAGGRPRGLGRGTALPGLRLLHTENQTLLTVLPPLNIVSLWDAGGSSAGCSWKAAGRPAHLPYPAPSTQPRLRTVRYADGAGGREAGGGVRLPAHRRESDWPFHFIVLISGPESHRLQAGLGLDQGKPCPWGQLKEELTLGCQPCPCPILTSSAFLNCFELNCYLDICRFTHRFKK